MYLCPDKGAAEQVVVSGILPILALSLRHRGPLTPLTAKLVAELAKECKRFARVRLHRFSVCPDLLYASDSRSRRFPSAVIRKGFGDAGLAAALLPVLTSTNQELLLHAARAIARMSHDSCKWRRPDLILSVLAPEVLKCNQLVIMTSLTLL